MSSTKLNVALLARFFAVHRLVAAKTFYFGVGGDILSFRRLIEKDGVFDVKVVFSAQAFVRREILELTFKA